LRRETKKIMVGNVPVGGKSPISIQSMLTTQAKNIEKIEQEINYIHQAGCDIIRLAVKDEEDADALKTIVKKSPIPVVADIHYNFRLALKSIKNGASKIRINPGNIGSDSNVEAIIKTAEEYNCPIRIGVNSGSLPSKYHTPTPEAMVETALSYIDFFEKHNFEKIIISLKSSSIETTVKSYELLSDKCDYPFHCGITEAGLPEHGIIKSSAGIGILIWKGLVDTFRISLTAPPVEEIICAKRLLKYMGVQIEIPELISCPTCGRCEINLFELAKDVEKIISSLKKPIKVAVMGCVVNGPGEAKEADIGIAGGKNKGIIFIKGEPVETVDGNMLLERFKFHLSKIV